MLVLKRKVEESITIADKIRIKILSIGGESVNVGVEAPREIKVFRTDNLNEENGNGNSNGNGNGRMKKTSGNGNGKKFTKKDVCNDDNKDSHTFNQPYK